MEGYRRSAHTVYNLHYHFVFGTKYRKPVLKGEIAVEVRDLIREICKGSGIEISSGHVRPTDEGCARRSGVGTCGPVATSSRPVAM